MSDFAEDQATTQRCPNVRTLREFFRKVEADQNSIGPQHFSRSAGFTSAKRAKPFSLSTLTYAAVNLGAPMTVGGNIFRVVWAKALGAGALTMLSVRQRIPGNLNLPDPLDKIRFQTYVNNVAVGAAIDLVDNYVGEDIDYATLAPAGYTFVANDVIDVRITVTDTAGLGYGPFQVYWEVALTFTEELVTF